MDRRYLAGAVAGAVLGGSLTGAAGCYAVGLAGADPTGLGRALVERLEADRRRAELERDLARDQLRRRLLAERFGVSAPPLIPPAAPEVGPGDLIPPQTLPFPARPAGGPVEQ